MLPSLTMLGRLKRAGRDAAYHGTPAEKCPYWTKELAEAWLSGHKLGLVDRAHDLEANRHPDHPVRIVRK